MRISQSLVQKAPAATSSFEIKNAWSKMPQRKHPRTTAATVSQAVLPKTLGAWITEMRLAHQKTVMSRPKAGGRAVMKSWSRIDLAERAGISEPTLLRIETDDEFPRFDVIDSIIKALGLFAWQEQMLMDFWLARSASTRRPGSSIAESVRRVAVNVLEELTFPAQVLDELYFVKARNRYAVALAVALSIQAEPSSQLNALLNLFGQSVSPNWDESSDIVLNRGLQQFLSHSAQSSTQPGYVALLKKLESRLKVDGSWRAALHSDDISMQSGCKIKFRFPDFGRMEFVVIEQSLGGGSAFILRVYVPVQADAYQRFRIWADESDTRMVLSQDWAS
jgi:transcriptional regulator with XRE-family HTH domain